MGIHQPTPAVFAFREPGPRSSPQQGASGFGFPGNIAEASAGQVQVEGQGHQISDQQTGAVASDSRTEPGSISFKAPGLPVDTAPSVTGPASTSQGAFTSEEQLMHYEWTRVASFALFPLGCGMSTTRLAREGWYYLGSGEGDLTKCFSCGVVHQGWQRGEDPRAYHNPNCRLVNSVNCSTNVVKYMYRYRISNEFSFQTMYYETSCMFYIPESLAR